MVACEQALRGVLAAGRGKEGELATTSLEFEYLHRKNRCEMLIGGDDISNDVITLGACFHVPLNVSLHSRSFPLRADWRKLDSSVDGEPQGNWKQNSNSRDVVTSSPSFSRSTTERSGELSRRQGSWLLLGLTFLILFGFIRKDIYLFGGSNDKAKVPTPFEDVYKLSMCK